MLLQGKCLYDRINKERVFCVSEQEKTIFAERLRQLRAQLGITQKEFAKRAGVTPASLSAYETGRKSPSVQIAAQIANTFETSLDWLCGIEVKAKKDNQSDDHELLKRIAYFVQEPHYQFNVFQGVETHKWELCDGTTDGEDIEYADLRTYRPDLIKFLSTIDSLFKLNREGTLDDDMLDACIDSASKKVDCLDDIPFL